MSLELPLKLKWAMVSSWVIKGPDILRTDSTLKTINEVLGLGYTRAVSGGT